MGLLDDMLGSAVPQGGISKPLMLALLALLGSGALFGGKDSEAVPAKPGGSRPPADEGGGLLDGLGGLLDRFRQSGQGTAARIVHRYTFAIPGLALGQTSLFRRVRSEMRSGRTFSRRWPSDRACRRRNCANCCRRFSQVWWIN